MWSVVAILSSEVDADTKVETKPTELSNTPIWSTNLSLDGFDLGSNSLTIEFVLHSSLGRIHITKIMFPTGRLNYVHEVTDNSPSVERTYDSIPVTHILLVDSIVEISYIAYKYNEKINGQLAILGQINISALLLKYDIKSMLMHTGHKITCLINETYLGRPQECSTRNDFRSYYWKSGVVNNIKSPRGSLTPRGTYVPPSIMVSPRHVTDFDLIVEYNSDMSLIRMATPAGMKKHAILTNYVPDNDAYSNPKTLLPIYFSDSDKPLVFKFFNFKFTPPKCVEITVKWKDFIGSRPLVKYDEPVIPEKRGILRRKEEKNNKRDDRMYMYAVELLSGLRMVIHYYMVDASKLRIILVYLYVEDFEKTLEMNVEQERVTV